MHDHHRVHLERESLESSSLIDSALREPPAYMLAGPRATLLARELTCPIAGTLGKPEELLEAVRTAFAEGPEPKRAFLVGAIPFSPTEPVALARADGVLRAGAWHPRALSGVCDSELERTPAERRVTEWEDPDAYREAVQKSLFAIQSGQVDKVVLARRQELSFDRPIDIGRVLRRLRRDNPFGYTFGIRLDVGSEPRGKAQHTDVLPRERPCGAPTPSRYLIGASPELLLSRHGQRVISIPLAGTCRRGHNPSEDRLLRSRLAVSDKGLREHEIVVQSVVESLRPLTTLLRVERRPTVVATPTMFHLGTKIEARLSDRGTHALRLAMALQPTPAVCGRPREAAAQLIAELEECGRGFFAGSVGYMDSEGNGEFIVSIRCAEVEPFRARLHAGAGIVLGSDPDEELAETKMKLNVVRQALGLGESQ